MKTKIYLAYGSNLNLEQMESRCPYAELLGYTMLPNTRLIYRGSLSGYYLSIEPAEPGTQRTVPCGVFRITPEDEYRLDIYEGYPHFYDKQFYRNLTLYTMDGKLRGHGLSAMAYILPSSAPAGLPRKQYVDTCIAGYEAFHFDRKHLRIAINDTYAEMEKQQ